MTDDSLILVHERIPKGKAFEGIMLASMFATGQLLFGMIYAFAGIALTTGGEIASGLLNFLPGWGRIIGKFVSLPLGAVNMSIGLAVVFFGFLFSSLIATSGFVTMALWFKSRGVSFFDKGMTPRLIGFILSYFIPFSGVVTTILMIRHVQKKDSEVQ